MTVVVLKGKTGYGGFEGYCPHGHTVLIKQHFGGWLHGLPSSVETAEL